MLLLHRLSSFLIDLASLIDHSLAFVQGLKFSVRQSESQSNDKISATGDLSDLFVIEGFYSVRC